MSPKFSLAHLTVLQCSPLEMVAIAEKTGYDYVSFRMTSVTPTEKIFPLMTDKALMKEAQTRLKESGVKVLDIELARMDAQTEPESYLPLLEAGAQLGAAAVITQLPDYDRYRATDRFAKLCELAKPFNLTIDLEFPSWTQVPNLETAVAILKAADCDNAGILVDTLHFHRSGSSLELLKSLPREWFHFIHLCDAKGNVPDTQEGLIFTAREDRFFPGEGDINIGEILDCMPEAPFSLEIPNAPRIKQLGPEEFARQAIVASKAFFENKKN